MRRVVRRRPLLLDVGLYLGFSVFSLATAVWSEFFGYRVWGALASVGYLFGLLQAVLLAAGRRLPGRVLGSRWTPVGLVVSLGMIVPLVVLLFERLANVLWSEQPEVWEVERGAQLLLAHGTPYLDFATLGRPPIVDDYVPYGPAMMVFGLPRAVFGLSELTDARVMFGLVSIGAVALALRLAGWPKVPVRAAQFALACPFTVLTFSVSGDDLAVAALIVLALALLHRGRSAWCGLVIAVAVSMKLMAAPALVVLAVAVLAMYGWRGSRRFLLAAVGTGAVLNLPVFLVDPTSFVEQVVRFPLGLGQAHSPAASPFPGHLLSELGPVGHDTALALLALLGLVMAVWLGRRPPRSAADAAVRIAVGLAAAFLLAPATRYGYLVYPCVLLGVAIALRLPEPEGDHESVLEPALAAD